MNERQQKLVLFFGIGFGLLFGTVVSTLIAAFVAWMLGFTVDFGLIALTAFVTVFLAEWISFTLAPEQPTIISKEDKEASTNDDDQGTT